MELFCFAVASKKVHGDGTCDFLTLIWKRAWRGNEEMLTSVQNLCYNHACRVALCIVHAACFHPVHGAMVHFFKCACAPPPRG
jgi:hypothetical protein